MSNNITIELHPDDRKRLDEVAALLGQIFGEQKQYNEFISRLLAGHLTATAPRTAQESAAPNTSHPVDEISPHAAPEPVVEPEPETVEDKPRWTKDDLTKKVQALAAPGTGKRDKVREIVKSYAANVGAIPEDKYDEVMDKLTALEQED